MIAEADRTCWLRYLKLDEHTKTYGDLDMLVELEFLAGNLGSEPPVVMRPGVDLRNYSLRRLSFAHADLRGARLYGLALSGTSFEGADMRGAYLENCLMYECTLVGADLREAHFHNTTAALGTCSIETDFTDAVLTGQPITAPYGWALQPGTDRLYRKKP